MHGPLLKEMLSGTGSDPVIDLHRIIQRGEFLLVKTARTPYASTDQNVALASMFIHDIIEAVLIGGIFDTILQARVVTEVWGKGYYTFFSHTTHSCVEHRHQWQIPYANSPMPDGDLAPQT